MIPPPRRDKTRINEMIREREVRLIDANEQHLGVVPIDKALQIAQEANLDLVEVATTSRPHVCRVMDYGKYKYEQKRRTKEARKRQHTISVKEVKFRPKISTHDYDFKMRNVERFLEHGDKVKIVMMFRGREIAHTELGKTLLEKIASEVKEYGSVESFPKFEGKTLIMVMAPLPQRKKKPKSEEETLVVDEKEPEKTDREPVHAKDENP